MPNLERSSSCVLSSFSELSKRYYNDPNYNGILCTAFQDSLIKHLSHLNLWKRDPFESHTIPEWEKIIFEIFNKLEEAKKKEIFNSIRKEFFRK